ncbi:MAG: hypothetical protein ABIO55_03885 [Ginsengibacter sp.]
MQLVNIMIPPKLKLSCLLLLALPLITFSQENSPYSRYGIGNLVPDGNILNRGMGGISAGTADPANVNFINPAAYSNLLYTTLDIGAEVDSRTLNSTNPQNKFTSNNAIISYLQLGIPLLNGNKSAISKKISWGINFGLRPVSKINYKINSFGRTNIDSLVSTYEGNGGANEAFLGTGIKIKNVSFGVNIGYLFGSKDYSTRLVFLNDSIPYYSSNSETKTSFGGLIFDGGIQYISKIKGGLFRAGVYGKMQQKLNASQDVLRETFSYNAQTGNPDRIDSVYEKKDQKGKIEMPSTVGFGFTIEKVHFLFGADFEMTNWDNYRFYGQKDFVKNSWITKVGFQFFPATLESKKYWNFVKYRFGLYFGPDYITAGNKLPQYGITAGASFPLKLKTNFYETQHSIMNIGVEYGNRGDKNNNIRENILRITLGFSLSDIWFRRYKYD